MYCSGYERDCCTFLSKELFISFRYNKGSINFVMHVHFCLSLYVMMISCFRLRIAAESLIGMERSRSVFNEVRTLQ